MGQIALSLPQVGQLNASQEPLIPADFATIQTVINGNLDATNLSATLAQAASVNQGGQTMKGAVNIVAPDSRTNVAYGTMPTPDQVTGIVLPANGLIAVWYQATWQESVIDAASAAIFLGANQTQAAAATAPAAESALTGAGGAITARNMPLSTCPVGLISSSPVPGGYSGDVTTGQVVGIASTTQPLYAQFSSEAIFNVPAAFGGPCYLFAAAGTYTVSVQFKASSGSVTAANRKLWVMAYSFA